VTSLVGVVWGDAVDAVDDVDGDGVALLCERLTAPTFRQQLASSPQHHFSEVAVPSQGVILTFPFEFPFVFCAHISIAPLHPGPGTRTGSMQTLRQFPEFQSSNVHSSLHQVVPVLPSSEVKLFSQRPLGRQRSTVSLEVDMSGGRRPP
jgi:hypothetical protein